MEKKYITNINLNILMNLFDSKIIRKENSDMGKFTTLDKDYIIILERKNSKLWYTDTSNKYLCIFNFYNNLNIHLFSLTLSEQDIFTFLDNVYSCIIEFNVPELFIPINAKDDKLNLYNFSFDKIKQKDNLGLPLEYDNDFYYFRIFQYNTINKIQIERICIRFDMDSLIDFLDLIYFIFLIDIDNHEVLNTDWLF